ncbi:MAG: hypothetical protein ACXABY_15830 [Candidatus Thorarchaeota archaeon]|jgi:hypothetical protein
MGEKCGNCLWWESPEKGDDGQCQCKPVESQAVNGEPYPRPAHRNGGWCDRWQPTTVDSRPVGVGE